MKLKFKVNLGDFVTKNYSYYFTVNYSYINMSCVFIQCNFVREIPKTTVLSAND